MQNNLLVTKFHPPILPPNSIQRPDLNRRLSEGLDAGKSLSLVSAPAGFGKSVCVQGWAGSLNRPYTWISLDPLDNDPLRFFSYLVTGLQMQNEQLGKELAGVLRSGQVPPPGMIATALINDMVWLRQLFLLVLDDFHQIQERVVLEVIEQLVSGQHANLHVVLITREDPLLPLARMRAKNQLTEVRAVDLRFTTHEVEVFLNRTMGLSVTRADAAALETRTEGWAAGVQLAGLSMRGRADYANFISGLSGNHRFILNYLTEEVLDHVHGEVKEFLLQTSILDKLNGDVCDAVCGRSDSAGVLEKLLSANLFIIPLDEEQRWYRYHHLFADLLRSRRVQGQASETVKLHLRASEWYEKAGLPGDAISHALEAKDYPRAVKLIEQHAGGMVNQGYAKTVEEWMERIPTEWQSRSLKANLAFAWMHLLRGTYERSAFYLKRAEWAITEIEKLATDGERGAATALRAEWYALRSGLLSVHGKSTESTQSARVALELARVEDANIRGLAYFRLGGGYRESGDFQLAEDSFQEAIRYSRAAENQVSEMLAVAQLALMAYQNGKLRFSYEVSRQAVERMTSSGRTSPISGAVYGAMGRVEYEWNQLSEARASYERGLHLSNMGGHNAGVILIKALQGQVHAAAGNLREAFDAVQQAAGLVKLGAPAWLIPEILALQVRILLLQGNHDAASDLLAPYTTASEFGGRASNLVILAQLRLQLHLTKNGSQENVGKALDLADRLVENTFGTGQKGLGLQSLVIRALLRDAAGRSQSAMEDILLAVRTASPEGYARVFLDEGDVMAELLMQVHSQAAGHEGDLIQRLLSKFGITEFRLPSSQAGASLEQKNVKGVEPLTDREVEVLRLIAEGLTYDEIAGRLVISVNTVRYYVKEIYSKLNVNNRTKAVAAANKRGIL